MALSTRDLRRKIKSVQGTKQLTSAMQMVAASKMQKAIEANQKSREYSRLAWEIIRDLARKTETSQYPLLSERSEIKQTLLIVVTSNKGLCGAFNTQILKKTSELIHENSNSQIITLGIKARNYVGRFFPQKLVADFPLPEKVIEFKDISPIAKLAIDDYIAKKYDKISIVYNHFISKIKQSVIARQILPIPKFAEQIGEITFTANGQTEQNKPKSEEYIFEPNPKTVLDFLLPKIIQTQVYQIALESNASEQSARMIAMKNATDNARDLIDDLQLTYNTIRQAAITSEIAEISAGAEALNA